MDWAISVYWWILIFVHKNTSYKIPYVTVSFTEEGHSSLSDRLKILEKAELKTKDRNSHITSLNSFGAFHSKVNWAIAPVPSMLSLHNVY
jgi:hypothetical protein